MTRLAVLLLILLLGAGLVVAADAQPAGDRPPAGPPPPGAPGGGAADRPDVNVDIRSDRGGDDGGAALPRQTEGTRILGLSPAMAVLLSAAILVVVILAIVSMARGGGRTDIDVDRRP